MPTITHTAVVRKSGKASTQPIQAHGRSMSRVTVSWLAWP